MKDTTTTTMIEDTITENANIPALKSSNHSNTKDLTKYPQPNTGMSESGCFLSTQKLDEIKTLAQYVASSPIYSAAFEVEKTTEDGRTTIEVDVNAIISCMAIGAELGLSPMKAITFGRALNRNAVIAATYGQNMGLNPLFAINNVFVFTTGGRELVYTGIHAVNACLTQLHVITDIINDGRVHYQYINPKTKDYVEFDASTHIIINGIKADVLKQALIDGKVPVRKVKPDPNDILATVKLTRGTNSLTRSYSLQEAIDAGLHAGITSNGDEVDGKDNWNKHPATMLVKMATMLAARIIAADKLGGVYLDIEVPIVSRYNSDAGEDTQYEEI